MGHEESKDNETNKEQSKEEQKEKKIEIDPNIVIPAAPVYYRCGADDLKITPKAIGPENIAPIKKDDGDK
jgi:hypothetical protein